MIQFKARAPVNRKSPQAWYIQGVNINYSFKTLERLAIEQGADIANMDKRKAFKKTRNGCIILYVQLLNSNLFTAHTGGLIEADANVPLIDFFQA